jgi:phosphotriesterase-related protein
MYQVHLRSVLGTVPLDELGFADAHTHAWIDVVKGADPAAPRLDDEGMLLSGLDAFSRAGGSVLVDCQPGFCGRNGNKLARLAALSGVIIIACTGFHRRQYYGPTSPIWQMSAQEACDRFFDEVKNGLLETRTEHRMVRPGFIKIAAEKTLVDSPRALFEAAAEANLATGLAIEMHTERGADVETFLPFFVERGLSPTRLVFCHMDKRPDFGLHRELAEAGVLLEYDTFFRPYYQLEDNVWPLLKRMIEAGLGSQIALATDMASEKMWRQPGPEAFITQIGGRLRNEGIDQMTLQQLLGGNIVGRLAITGEKQRAK